MRTKLATLVLLLGLLVGGLGYRRTQAQYYPPVQTLYLDLAGVQANLPLVAAAGYKVIAVVPLPAYDGTNQFYYRLYYQLAQ